MSGGFTSAIRLPASGPIAVSEKECRESGCPYCGFRSGSSMISGGGAATVSCGECQNTYIVLADGTTVSRIGLSNGDGPTIYPELQDHPRRGTPAHGRPDTRPEEGGEFFHARGIGLDNTPGCFVCGGPDGLRNNIAAFVQGKTAGERIVAMFVAHYGGACLDYRDYEPDWVQVKIGACDDHLGQLKQLCELTADGRITCERISEVARA